MIYKRFGKTELQMPVLSCGGMRFQQSWEDKTFDAVEKANQENVEKVIHRALELGINHIETARGYGTSELQLGKILPGIKRDSIIVQTKVNPSGEHGEFTRQFEQSLTNLQLGHVDLLSIHGINDQESYDWVMRDSGVLEEARALQKQGLCRHIGFATHGPSEIILKTVQTGEFDYVNLHWFYIFQKHRHVIEEAAERDMGVFIISPNDKGGKLYEPAKKLVDLCRPFSPMAFNDLFCLSNPHIHTLSQGVARPSDFDEHINALAYYETRQETIAPVVKLLDAEIARVSEDLGFDYWDYSVIPPWDTVPGEMSLQNIIWLWHLVKAFDMIEYGKMRYNLLGNGGSWFPGQKADMEKLGELHSVIKDPAVCSKVIEVLREAHQLLNDKPKERLSKSG